MHFDEQYVLVEPSFLTKSIPSPRWTSFPQKEHFFGEYKTSYHHHYFRSSFFQPFWSRDIKRSMQWRVNRPIHSSAISIDLPSTHYRKDVTVIVGEKLAYFAALAYGDGYAAYGEVRIVTANSIFRDALEDLVIMVAQEQNATYRVSEKASAITTNPKWEVVLNSTTVRRAFFDEQMRPKYDSIHSIALSEELAVDFQAGLTDAEGSLLAEKPIDSPHGRIFAASNSDKRLLGIARLSLVYRLRLEPTSVRIRLGSKKGRTHEMRGVELVTRRNNYVIEILSGAKRKWLERVGLRLRHPVKRAIAEQLLETYG